MIEKNVKSRIQNKHDIEANWAKAENFVPLIGEIIVYDIDENYDYERLKVGDGATPVTELPFWDENVSWNDLKDKPFGEEITEVVSETTIDGFADGYLELSADWALTVGNRYRVVYDGVEYECVAIGDPDGYFQWGLGNFIMIGGDDTGEPFTIICYAPGFLSIIDNDMTATSHTVSISEVNVFKLDDKFVNPADWNAENGEAGYMLNRPFGVKTLTEIFLKMIYVKLADDNSGNAVGWGDNPSYKLEAGKTYRVYEAGAGGFSNGYYEAIDATIDGTACVVLGNHKIAGLEDTGDRFAIVYYGETVMYALIAGYHGITGGDSGISFNIQEVGVSKLDQEYIPDTISRVGHTHSWEELNDKPFGETYGDTLTWDGNTEGLVCAGDIIYKVSDVVLSESDVNNIVLQTFAGTPCTEESTEITFYDDGSAMISGMPEGTSSYTDMIMLISVPVENFDLYDDGSIIVPYPGIYTNKDFSLTIPGYTGFPGIKPLDEKYLPANVATQEYVDNAIVQSDWNQNDETAADFIKNKPFDESETGGDTLTLGPINPETIDPSTLVGEVFLKVSDTIITMDDLSNGYTVKMGSFTAEIPPEEVGGTIMQVGDGIFVFGDAFVSVEERAVGVDFEGLTFPESGIYISSPILSGVVSLTIPGYTGFPSIKTIDPKYLPANVATQEYVDNAVVQSDWNQNNETAANFIKNKPSLVGKKNPEVESAEIFNNYATNKATGVYSHAEGSLTTASGISSHAEGAGTTASGAYSHAEGIRTKASGAYSHAEGFSSNMLPDTITGESTNDDIIAAWNNTNFSLAKDRSHAEGENTLALGNTSHAEGRRSTASGDVSHAEGSLTTASGISSHAEGAGTTASGNGSHAEGAGATASGAYSHAEGIRTKASGECSHAEGTDTTASGAYSHAEGFSSNRLPDTITSESTNDDIIAAWNSTKFSLAKGESSHVEGYNTLALGRYSHAEGIRTIASGVQSHAEGNNTTASGISSHAEGDATTASGISSHAEGAGTKASGDYSHAEGQGTVANCMHQHVQGKYNIIDDEDNFAHIVGNGNDGSTLSNAHTLDWSGNAWFQGDVYVGSTSGTNRDEGSKKLATEEYVDNAVVQPDWNQNDSSAADFIKNKPEIKPISYTLLFAKVDSESVGRLTETYNGEPMTMDRLYEIVQTNRTPIMVRDTSGALHFPASIWLGVNYCVVQIPSEFFINGGNNYVLKSYYTTEYTP